MPFNNGWRLKYDYMLPVHVGIYRDPTEGRRMPHFLVSEEEQAIPIRRCSTGGDKHYHDCFCINKPALIKGALGGDADKAAPSEWNDNSVRYRSMEQTDCVKFFISGWGSQGRWEETAGNILTKTYNRAEDLTRFHLLKEERLSSQHPNKRGHGRKALTGCWWALHL